MSRIPLRILATLKEVRRDASLDNASFGSDMVKVYERGVARPKKQRLDAFIKERTRLYRETWILPPLDEVIEWAEREARLVAEWAERWAERGEK